MYILDTFELVKSEDAEKDYFSILMVRTNNSVERVVLPDFLQNLVVKDITGLFQSLMINLK